MDKIIEISKKYKIPIIEDNAECFLGYYKNKLVGTFGEISSYSFEGSKHISCGEGESLQLIMKNMQPFVVKLVGKVLEC